MTAKPKSDQFFKIQTARTSADNTQYNKWRRLWDFKAICSDSGFETVDKIVTLILLLAILPAVTCKILKNKNLKKYE